MYIKYGKIDVMHRRPNFHVEAIIHFLGVRSWRMGVISDIIYHIDNQIWTQILTSTGNFKDFQPILSFDLQY